MRSIQFQRSFLQIRRIKLIQPYKPNQLNKLNKPNKPNRLNHMKRALVCGAGGFIGSHLVKKLKRENYWVRGVDLKYPEFSPTAADEFLLLDLREPENCLTALILSNEPHKPNRLNRPNRHNRPNKQNKLNRPNRPYQRYRPDKWSLICL